MEHFSKRFKCEMKPMQTAKLKAIAHHYGYDNLLHTLNIIVDQTYKELGLDNKGTDRD